MFLSFRFAGIVSSSPFSFCLPACYLQSPLLRIWIQGCPLNNCTAWQKLYCVDCLAHNVSGSNYLPFNLPSLSFMFLSLFFLACCLPLPFHFSCLPVSFIILYWQIKDKHALRIRIQGCTLNNCTACHKLYSVHLSALFDSRRVRFQRYLPFNLPSLSFIFLSFRFAGMLSLPSHFDCLIISFIILYWDSKKNMHLEFGFKVINCTACRKLYSVHCLAHDLSDSSIIFLLTCLHFLSCSFLCFFWHILFLYLSIFLVHLFPSSFFIGKSKKKRT